MRGKRLFRTASGISGRLLILPELGRVTGGVVLLLGVLEVFEEVGVEDGGGDFVVAGGPLAEVDGAAALGAERDFGGVEGNEFLADGAVEGFGHGGYSDGWGGSRDAEKLTHVKLNDSVRFMLVGWNRQRLPQL